MLPPNWRVISITKINVGVPSSSLESLPFQLVELFPWALASSFILNMGFTKMYAYLLICGDMYWRITFFFLDFITDNVMLDFKCTSVWNTGFLWSLHVALTNRVYHCWKTRTYPCGTSSVIMRFDLLSNHLDTTSLL